MAKVSKIVLSTVLGLVLCSGLTWLIAEYLAPGSFVVLLIWCVAGAALMTGVLSILDATRAALLACVLVAAALVIIPVIRKLELSKKVPYTAASSLFVGLICSRFYYKEF